MDNLTKKILGIKNLETRSCYWQDNAGNQIQVNRNVVTDGHESYGVVGDQYVPITHGEVYSRVMEWLPEGELVSSASNLNKSRAILTVELPEMFELKNGHSEEIKTYVNIFNSLDGEWPIGIIVSPLRVACTNQFTLLRREAYVRLNYKHHRKGLGRFQQEIPVIERVYNSMKGQLAIAKKLIDEPCTTAKGIELLDKMLKNQIITKSVKERADVLYNKPTRDEDEERTLWTLFNTITEPINEQLRDKQRTSSFDQLDRVGNHFASLVTV